MADVVVEKQEPCNLLLSESSLKDYVLDRIESLRLDAIKHLIEKENFKPESIDTEIYLNLRYHGTDTGMMCSSLVKKSAVHQLQVNDFRQAFLQRYQTEYGFLLQREIFIDDIRVRGIGKGFRHGVDGANFEDRPPGSDLQPTEVHYLKTMTIC
jgi:5-oxoprolinase (ATP-hydrolysing)